MGLVSDPLVRGPRIFSPLRQSRNNFGGKAGLDFLLVYLGSIIQKGDKFHAWRINQLLNIKIYCQAQVQVGGDGKEGLGHVNLNI